MPVAVSLMDLWSVPSTGISAALTAKSMTWTSPIICCLVWDPWNKVSVQSSGTVVLGLQK